MSSEVITIPVPPKKHRNFKRKIKKEDKKYDLINLEIDFLINVDKINKNIKSTTLSNSFVIRNIENVNLQQIEYLFSQINSYINSYLNSYNETLNLNQINEYIKIINNLFENSI